MTEFTCPNNVWRFKSSSSVIHLSQMKAVWLEAWGKLKFQKQTRTWIAPFEPMKSINKIYIVT